MKLKRRIIAILMSLAMVLAYMPAMAFADDGEAAGDSTQNTEVNPEADQGAKSETADTKSETADAISETEEQNEIDSSADFKDNGQENDSARNEPTRVRITGLGNNKDLLIQYFEIQFDGNQNAPNRRMLKAARSYHRNKLSEGGKEVYDELLPQIKEIAAGKRNEPRLSYSLQKISGAQELAGVIEAMAMDSPYEFYWYDKVEGLIEFNGEVMFSVAVDYRKELIDTIRIDPDEEDVFSLYSLDTNKVLAANKAADNARAIVDKYQDFSDFDKLLKYKNEICDLTAYDDDAGDMWKNVPYGDPWQMIYVFDGDPTTKVVCEGYSKAFQFLCDNSNFQSDQIECLTVTGWLGKGELVIPEENYGVYSNHMWNILHLDDGKVYIADITNADVDDRVRTNTLFLGGALPYESYKFFKFDTSGFGSATVSYAYDNDTLNTFEESELAVSTTPYKGVELTEDNVEVADAVYTGAKLEPAVTVTVDGEILTEGVDYELAYSNNINAGSGKVTVTGLVSYYGTVDRSFAIAKRAITPAVTLSTVNYTWNNGVKTPGVTVRYGTKTLKNGTDYTVAYQAGRKNIGRYNVTVTMKGNYSGRRVATFNINPKGTTAYKPKAAKKAFTAKWKKLTTKMPKATVTGYQVQYSTNKTFRTSAKTVTVKGAKKTSRKISSLKKKTTYYVRVRTYMSVGGRYYYSTWSAVKSVKTK